MNYCTRTGCYTETSSHTPSHGHEFSVSPTCILRRLRLASGRVYIDTILNSIVDLRNNCLTLGNKLRIALVSLFCDSSTESVVVVQQQLQTGQHNRSQARALEFRFFLDQDLDVVRDRVANGAYDCIENPTGVRFIKLRCEVGIDESFAVREVDCTDCSEDLIVLLATLVLLLACDLVSYRSALNQDIDQITAFVGLCCLAIRKHTIVDVVNILDYGIGSDDSAVKCCGACKACKEQDRGKASEMHDEDVLSILRCKLTMLERVRWNRAQLQLINMRSEIPKATPMRASVCFQSTSIIPYGRKKAVTLLPLIQNSCGRSHFTSHLIAEAGSDPVDLVGCRSSFVSTNIQGSTYIARSTSERGE